jgi:pimeloyl-ACP methyl ester carboxylesterase
MARRRGVAIAGPSRFSTAFVVRLLLVVGIFLLVCALILVAAGGFFTYRIVTDYNDTENVSPDSFLLSNYESLNFTDSQGGEHAGWLLRGLKGAPVIIVCHGYDSNRSEMLSLGTVLQENHFNVYLFNFRSVEGKHEVSDLGVWQAAVVESAVEKLMKQPGINTTRLGLFGKTTGGYAALVVAERNPLVKAVAVDNAFQSPVEMFNAEIDQLIGTTPLFRVVMDAEFRILNFRTQAPQLSSDLSKLNTVPKFFISGRDMPALAKTTEAFYNGTGQPKRLLVMDHTQSGFMSGTEKKEYENQILAFYLQNLPLRAD